MSLNEPTPAPADLNNPQYYRQNFESVVAWVTRHYNDLLTDRERDHFERLMTLPQSPRALLARLIMRRGPLFRSDELHYPEIDDDLKPVLTRLAEEGFLAGNAPPTVAEVGRLFRRHELRSACVSLACFPRGAHRWRKADLMQWISGCTAEQWQRLVDALYGDSPWVSLTRPDWYERLRLLFFGNMRQSWTDFILVELGQTRYEPVPIDGDSRPFRCRRELLAYEQLSRARDMMEAPADPENTAHIIPPLPLQPAWLEARRSRVLLSLGTEAYRQRQWSLALRAWAISGEPDALVRRVRLLEQRGFGPQAARESLSGLEQPLPATARENLHRVLTRCQGRASAPRPARRQLASARATLLSPPRGNRVERVAAEALAAGGKEVFYTENQLFTGLFGLVFWRALFAPVPGAFFHPFQASPADLYDPQFISRRRGLFDEALYSLTTDSGPARILATYDDRVGTTNHFVNWRLLRRDVVQSAVTVIPQSHLSAFMQYMLDDLRRHRSGFPDLLVIDGPARRYELIEIKGPGDQLQPQQSFFLEWCRSRDIPASVLYTEWP